MIFSLDVLEPGLTVWQIAIGLFMHNIPALILLIVLIISWKHEIVGGIVFTLAGLFYILVSAIIALPALFIGLFFMINWARKRKAKFSYS
jgi:hypothetical protein